VLGFTAQKYIMKKDDATMTSSFFICLNFYFSGGTQDF
jgi:hypothetical protein